MVGILCLFVAFFLFNLISVVLAFIGINKAFSVIFAGVICLIALLYFFSNFKVEINGKEYRLPIFPGPNLLKITLIAVIVIAVVVKIFNLDNNIYIIEDSYVYYLENEKIVSKARIKGEEVFLLKKNISMGNGEKFSLVMFKNDDEIFSEGEEALVPESALKKKIKELNLIKIKKDFSSFEDSLKGMKNRLVGFGNLGLAKKQSGVVELTPEEVFKGDLYGDSPDKLKLFVAGFKNGDVVEFQEDFLIKTNGGQTYNTVLFADNKNIKSFQGDVIPRGTRFQVRGEKGVYLLFFSEGRTQVEFSTLVLKKID